MPITIQHLEVRFDVDAGEEDAAFVRLFQKYMRAYTQQQNERAKTDHTAEQDRALGDREAD